MRPLAVPRHWKAGDNRLQFFSPGGREPLSARNVPAAPPVRLLFRNIFFQGSRRLPLIHKSALKDHSLILFLSDSALFPRYLQPSQAFRFPYRFEISADP